MARKTTRLYYGMSNKNKPLYWTMKVTNATRAVKLKGTVEDAMRGTPGRSIGCHLSNTAQRNSEAFDHPVEYVSFTRSVALVITRIVNGVPTRCVRYRHPYSKYVDLNDKDPTKKVVKEHPEMFNRQFTLGPYHSQEGHWKPEYGRKETGKRAKFQMATGELRRLADAGMVVAPLA